MPKQERFLPSRIGRFNYWKFFRPDGLNVARPAQEHIIKQFHLLLAASPHVWDKEVRPWLHRSVLDIPDRQFFALEYYVESDKEWSQDREAWKVFRRLSLAQQASIKRLDRQTWQRRLKKTTWTSLLAEIAGDQELYRKYCETPPMSGDLNGTNQRIYETYSKQHTQLLGGGSFVPHSKRHRFVDPLDHRKSLLEKGRLPSESIFPLSKNWTKMTPAEKRTAKLSTLHWFHHALRNMNEYRHNRPSVHWSPECAKFCHRIQQRLYNR